MITWKQIIEIEPRLAKLYTEACAVKDRGGNSFCANNVWYGYGNNIGFKGRVYHLVGFAAKDDRIKTMEAYDVAYEKIYEALPNCRNCSCV
jgi:hypothetical protein